MRIVLKRCAAYLIDIILVSLISTVLTSNGFINRDYNKYIETYEAYENEYINYTQSMESLEKELSDEEITEKEYNKQIEKLNEEYEKIDINYNYKLIKLSIISTTISIVVIVLYFVVLQYLLKGQTLGKKIMKLQIKSNNNKKLNIFNYILRTLILNGVLINTMSIIFLLILSKNNYLIYNQIIYVLSYVIETTIIFMIAFDKKHRGLHDYISNTQVIDLSEVKEDDL